MLALPVNKWSKSLRYTCCLMFAAAGYPGLWADKALLKDRFVYR